MTLFLLIIMIFADQQAIREFADEHNIHGQVVIYGGYGKDYKATQSANTYRPHTEGDMSQDKLDEAAKLLDDFFTKPDNPMPYGMWGENFTDKIKPFFYGSGENIGSGERYERSYDDIISVLEKARKALKYGITTYFGGATHNSQQGVPSIAFTSVKLDLVDELFLKEVAEKSKPKNNWDFGHYISITKNFNYTRDLPILYPENLKIHDL